MRQHDIGDDTRAAEQAARQSTRTKLADMVAGWAHRIRSGDIDPELADILRPVPLPHEIDPG